MSGNIAQLSQAHFPSLFALEEAPAPNIGENQFKPLSWLTSLQRKDKQSPSGRLAAAGRSLFLFRLRLLYRKQ